jgi:hypothetical protein
VRLRTRACAALVLFTCLGSLAACGENADQREARKTVARFYDALKRHDATTACGLVSPAVADGMVRAWGARGKPCVAGLRLVFQRVGRGSNPHVFDSVPHDVAATTDGNRATVVVKRGYQRRHVSLRRVGDSWQITGWAAGQSPTP